VPCAKYCGHFGHYVWVFCVMLICVEWLAFLKCLGVRNHDIPLHCHLVLAFCQLCQYRVWTDTHVLEPFLYSVPQKGLKTKSECSFLVTSHRNKIKSAIKAIKVPLSHYKVCLRRSFQRGKIMHLSSGKLFLLPVKSIRAGERPEWWIDTSFYWAK